MAEREVVEVARRDLLGRDDDLVAVGLALDRERRVQQADVPRRAVVRRRTSRSWSGECGARFVAKQRPWTITSSAVQVDLGWSGSRTVTRSEPTAPASAARS